MAQGPREGRDRHGGATIGLLDKAIGRSQGGGGWGGRETINVWERELMKDVEGIGRGRGWSKAMNCSSISICHHYPSFP
jgi:hypothetical protein